MRCNKRKIKVLPVHEMKAYGEVKVHFPLFFTYTTEGD
jgi:hypothetical protein